MKYPDFVYGVLEPIFEFINKIYSFIFSLGNYILFLWFLYLFYMLYKGARKKERDERFHSYALSKSRKYGRGGMIVCVVIAVLFLSNILIMVLDSLSVYFPIPFIYKILFSLDYKLLEDNFYNSLIRGEIAVLPMEQFFLYSLGFISFICFILLTFGIFLLIYNERILHTRWKPFKLITIGLIGIIIVGFTLPFDIMNGLIFDVYIKKGWH